MKYLNKIPNIWQRTSFEGYHSGFITTDVKKTAKGYRIKRFSNYITILNIDLEVLPNGFAKATVKVDKNYHPKYQYTMYFNSAMVEVGNRKIWMSLQQK